ncbi:MAG: response regulator transcription factor [Crocinitomicaceae bacterium]|nr:response regulator transcription factor [Crocinitomicaceae bacterium]MBK8925401.1 response regulator transcription factor [Crocinitomicaceae bacterium]
MSGKIKAILADDEESARDVLENLLKRFCPDIELVGKYENLENAVQAIKEHKPDLVFLDIEMPNYAGYEIVRFFDTIDFEIIFITAYDSYAVKAFEVAALDYLLKPIDIERLKNAVQRAKSRIGKSSLDENLNVLEKTIKNKHISNILIAEKGIQHVVDIDQIIAIEAQESYCFLYTGSKKFLVSKNLRHFENILQDHPNFFRTHKSWIVNKKHLISFSNSDNSITLNGNIEARLSKYRKEEFDQFLA